MLVLPIAHRQAIWAPPMTVAKVTIGLGVGDRYSQMTITKNVAVSTPAEPCPRGFEIPILKRLL